MTPRSAIGLQFGLPAPRLRRPADRGAWPACALAQPVLWPVRSRRAARLYLRLALDRSARALAAPVAGRLPDARLSRPLPLPARGLSPA